MSDVPRHDIPNGGRSGFVMNGGEQVHYLEWGRAGAPAVLCLHGGGQTAYMYEALGAALAERAHVLAPDLPAHGDSDPLPRQEMGEGIAGIYPCTSCSRPPCRRWSTSSAWAGWWWWAHRWAG